jgi:hypothetical protein
VASALRKLRNWERQCKTISTVESCLATSSYIVHTKPILGNKKSTIIERCLDHNVPTACSWKGLAVTGVMAWGREEKKVAGNIGAWGWGWGLLCGAPQNIWRHGSSLRSGLDGRLPCIRTVRNNKPEVEEPLCGASMHGEILYENGSNAEYYARPFISGGRVHPEAPGVVCECVPD